MYHEPLVGHKIILESKEKGVKTAGQDQFLTYWARGWRVISRVKTTGDWFNLFVNITIGPSGKQSDIY